MQCVKRTAAVVMVCLGIAAATASAQPLAERVPADAMVYVGWAGSTQLGEAYDNSHLKAVLADSGVAELLEQTLPKLIDRIPEQQPRAMLGMLHEAAGAMLRHPTAMYVTHRGEGQAPPSMMILCAAGEQADAVAKTVRPMVQQAAAAGGAPVAMAVQDGLVTVRVVAPAEPVAKRSESLAATARMRRSMKRTGVEPIIAAYVDGAKLLATAEKAAEMRGEAARFRQTRDVLGLDGIKSLAWAGGFADADWVSGRYVEAPAPRKGIAAFLDGGEPLSEAAMKLVPRTAAVAGGGKLDLAALHDAILGGMKQTDEAAVDRVEAMSKQVQQQFGFDVRDDLLGGLGDEWLWYTDAHVAGTNMVGTVFVNPLRKADAAERALERLLAMGNAMLAQQARDEQIKFEIRRREIDGVTMHYLAMAFVSPALAFHEGRLYIGLYPQSVAGAIAHEKTEGSILDNPAFKLRRAQVGAENVTGFEYVAADDLLAQGYPTMMILSRTLMGSADMWGMRTPPALLPKLGTLQRHAAPTGAFAWSDETGFYSRSRSFMPGAATLGGLSVTDIAGPQTAVAAGIVLPAIGRARELAERTASAAQLRGIAQAIIVYDAQHKRLPDDFGQLVKADLVQPTMFVHPQSHKSPPAGASREKLADWVVNNSDYVYVGHGERLSFNAGEVIAYERPEAPWTREGLNIAFGDGHVSWVERSEAMKLIEKAKQRAKEQAKEEAKGE